MNYPLEKEILAKMDASGVPSRIIGSHNRVTGIPGDNPQQSYLESKRTLLVGVKRDLRLDTCKPSADFEFSMDTMPICFAAWPNGWTRFPLISALN